MLALVKKTMGDVKMSIDELVSLESASPELATARARRNELLLQLRDLQIGLNALAREYEAFKAYPALARKPIDRDGEHRVSALLDGVAPPAVPPPEHLVALEKMAKKTQEVDDIKKAIAILDARIAELVRSASATVCERIAPHYAERVAAVARGLIALHATHVAYDELADNLNAQGVWWTRLGPMPPNFLDSSRDKSGHVARYLKEAAARGFISADEIPERLR